VYQDLSLGVTLSYEEFSLSPTTADIGQLQAQVCDEGNISELRTESGEDLCALFAHGSRDRGYVRGTSGRPRAGTAYTRVTREVALMQDDRALQ
jgi:hypothetical protein